MDMINSKHSKNPLVTNNKTINLCQHYALMDLLIEHSTDFNFEKIFNVNSKINFNELSEKSLSDVRNCCSNTKYGNCALCSEYVCQKLAKFFCFVPELKFLLDRIHNAIK